MQDTPKVRFLDRSTPPHIVTLVLLSGMSALAMNVFLPSLPQMTAHFDTSYQLMQLSVAVYLGVNAVLQIVIGPISDKLGRRPVLLWGVAVGSGTVGNIESFVAEVLALHEALERLEAFDERQACIVELRYFVGLTIAECARVMEISPATVKREWTSARAWLYREMKRIRGDEMPPGDAESESTS